MAESKIRHIESRTEVKEEPAGWTHIIITAHDSETGEPISDQEINAGFANLTMTGIHVILREPELANRWPMFGVIAEIHDKYQVGLDLDGGKRCMVPRAEFHALYEVD